MTNTLTFSVSSDSSTSITGSQAEIGTQEIVINQTFPANSTGVDLPVAFTAAGLQSLFLLASKNLTIQVNSTSAPTLVINLVAGTPFVWDRSPGYFANPFTSTGTVTDFFVTCSAAANLRGKVLKA